MSELVDLRLERALRAMPPGWSILRRGRRWQARLIVGGRVQVSFFVEDPSDAPTVATHADPCVRL